ncbi:hypothetical protein NFI96_008024 [Prochilodus magdalenae]|nr:hypothetical protein NFI96_008024 [Prochilodus magdalenae]
MAGKETQSKASVYRSVSFKKLESRNVNKSGVEDQQHHKSEDLESAALPPQAAETAGEKAQPSDTPSVAVARKVSKISAASLSTAELKTGCSVRLLSEKFSAGSSAVGSKPAARLRADGSPSQDTRGLPEQSGDPVDHPRADKPTKDRKSLSAQESVSGSDSDRGQRRRVRKSAAANPGKRGSSAVSPSSANFASLNSDDDVFVLGTPVYKSRRSYRSSHGETVLVDSNWPSVPKIRELFGDGHRKQHRSTSDADDLKLAGHHLHSFDGSTSSDRSDRQSPLPRGAWQDANSSDYGAGRLSADSLSHKEKTCTEKTSRDDLSCEKERKRPSDTGGPGSWPGRVDGDPKPSPPTPPPRSSSVDSPLRSRSCAYREQLQEQRQRAKQPQPPDSLHSSHSSSKPHKGPSVEVEPARRASSGGEEEEEEEEDKSRRQTGRNTVSLIGSGGGTAAHFSRNTKHGAWAKALRRSSGSEEDSPAGLAHHSRDVRRRSLRKKKKSSCSRDDGESDDSDSQPVMMEHLERHQQSCDSQKEGRRLEGFQSKPSFGGRTWERGHPAQGSSVVQDTYRRLYKASEGQVGTSHIPLVSRVSKVTIPSFLLSPLGSRSSSRYSSTETLKEEDQPSASHASSSVLSKTYHGNATMYRSPSFGYGDNFSRSPVRVRPRLVPGVNPGDGVPGASENRLYRGPATNEKKEKDRKSMSNPDIASETLSLLSYLKTDLSELRMKRRGRDGEEAPNSSSQSAPGTSAVYRMGSRPPGLNARRPSLKDLTATLRRAKSFTYSEKPLGRSYSGSGAAVRSSSEQRLDCEGDSDRVVVSDREVESDDCRGGYGYDEPMPTPLQDRYVQEARQVIRDICKMSASKDEDDEDDEGFKGKESFVLEEEDKEAEKTKQQENKDVQTGVAEYTEPPDRENGKCLARENSEENVFCDKSLDELSGHESSLTDEGIVTEPEAGGPSSGTDLLGQTLSVWNQSGLYEEQSGDMTLEKSVSAPAPSVRTEYEAVAIGGDVNISKNVSQAALEAPPTPSALRRRRKFSSAGNNGSDSSNGSNGESNGESAYRSLSDPMPRRRSVTEEASNGFSMDSNLLGSLSLNSKAGVGVDSSAADLSECTGSAASDLSVCSDSLRDYSTVIQSIVHEPGAMDKLIDEKANGKAVKKKSFSDPSRRGEPATSAADVQKQPSEPINESEQPIPPSSSEPILSEQRDELWELSSERRQAYTGRRSRSQSEHVLPSHLERNGDTKVDGEDSGFTFDPKLAQVLPPCTNRRSYKKRTQGVAHQQSCDDGDQLEEQQDREARQDDSTSILPQLPPKIRPKHVRHASEPATFVPIAPSNTTQGSTFKAPEPSRPSKPSQGEGTPSLEDVTEQYILALSPPEGASDAPTSAEEAGTEGTRSIPATPTSSSEPKLQRKSSVELTPAPLKAKPRVVSAMPSWSCAGT